MPAAPTDATVYIVRPHISAARLRRAPSTTASTIARLARNTLIYSRLLSDGEAVAIDDPTTPQAESKSRLWVAVVGYQRPGEPYTEAAGFIHSRLVRERREWMQV